MAGPSAQIGSIQSPTFMGAPPSPAEEALAPAQLNAPESGSMAVSGLPVVHLFCSVAPDADPGAIEVAVKAARSEGYTVVTAWLLGHKADLAVMALGPSFTRLRQLQNELAGASCTAVYSYVSLTEVSEYAKGLPNEALMARLRPNLPPDGMPAFCFYPMSKRRDPIDNWYALSFDRRLALMAGHGTVGRNYRGRVVQLITGSTGLDDYEWGVTLFGASHDDLKACVYEMRFDEVSARYADFGPFLTGVVAPLDEVLAAVGLRSGHRR